MTVTYGFYNSVAGDRKYNAEQLGKLFDGIIKDGVLSAIGQNLEVKATTGMNITVGIGRAWFNNTWTDNDALLPLTVPQSEVVLNRIDAVVLEINTNDDTRANTIKIVKGTPTSNPVAPTMIKTLKLNQYPLAFIAVNANVTTITQANITNKVGSSECPLATGVLQQMTTEIILAQWDAEYRLWYSGFQSALETWEASFKAASENWQTTEQQDFITWLNYIKSLFGSDPAAALQAQIDIIKFANGVTYNNSVSGLTATTVQAAIDEVNAKTGSTGVFINGKTTTTVGNTITETFTADGSTLVTTFNADGTITEAYTVGPVTKTKKTTFNPDGSISEVII